MQLAYVAASKQYSGYLTTKEGYERVEKHTRHALQLSPDLAAAHAALHDLYLARDLNWAAAKAELQRSLAIDPTNPHSLLSAAMISSILGENDEAERHIRAVMQRDPLNVDAKFNLASIYYCTGRLADAEGVLRSMLEDNPDYEWTRSWLARILLLQGKAEAARAELKLEPLEGARIAVLPMILHATGRQSEADAAMKVMIEYWAAEHAQGIARNYAYMGDHDRAMEWLERAYLQKDSGLLGIIGDPMYGNLPDDPRYKAFLRNRLKLPV